MAESCGSKCAWITKTCPIGLDHKIDGIKELIKERKDANDKDVRLAKMEVDRDLNSITTALDAIVKQLAPLATVLANREGSRKWSDWLVIIVGSAFTSAIMTFILSHKGV